MADMPSIFELDRRGKMPNGSTAKGLVLTMLWRWRRLLRIAGYTGVCFSGMCWAPVPGVRKQFGPSQ